MSEEQKPVGDEPRPVKAKKKRKPQRKELTATEAKFLEARLEGKTLAEASEAAGCVPLKQQGYKIEQRIREKAPDIFDAAGVTVDRLAKKVSQLLDAKKKLYYTSIVLDEREVEDSVTQRKAVDFGLRVHGVTEKGKEDTPPTINIQVNKASDDDIRRVLELAARISENAADVQSGVVQP